MRSCAHFGPEVRGALRVPMSNINLQLRELLWQAELAHRRGVVARWRGLDSRSLPEGRLTMAQSRGLTNVRKAGEMERV